MSTRPTNRGQNSAKAERERDLDDSSDPNLSLGLRKRKALAWSRNAQPENPKEGKPGQLSRPKGQGSSAIPDRGVADEQARDPGWEPGKQAHQPCPNRERWPAKGSRSISGLICGVAELSSEIQAAYLTGIDAGLGTESHRLEYRFLNFRPGDHGSRQAFRQKDTTAKLRQIPAKKFRQTCAASRGGSLRGW